MLVSFTNESLIEEPQDAQQQQLLDIMLKKVQYK